MNKRFAALLGCVIGATVLIGCNIENPSDPRPVITAAGNDLVINEVFHVSPTQSNPYSWIELYNPTNKIIRWFVETKIDDSTTVRDRLLVRFRTRRQFYNFSTTSLAFNPSYIVQTDSGDGYFTNYHTDEVIEGNQPILKDQWYSSTDSLIFPNEFVVIDNDANKFDDHTSTGPSAQADFAMTLAIGSIQNTPSPACILYIRNPLYTAGFSRDTNYYWVGANVIWDLLDAGEVALMRITDTVITKVDTIGGEIVIQKSYFPGDTTYIDVARYGNYRPSPDPFPANMPIGNIPNGSSLARYGGYFKTGNTQDEFYVSPNPIPGWYNQRQKR